MGVGITSNAHSTSIFPNLNLRRIYLLGLAILFDDAFLRLYNHSNAQDITSYPSQLDSDPIWLSLLFQTFLDLSYTKVRGGLDESLMHSTAPHGFVRSSPKAGISSVS